MRKNIYLILLLLVTLFASCTTIKKTSSTADVASSVYTHPVVADLDVMPVKAEKTFTWNFFPFNIGEPDIEDVKQNVTAELLAENGADVLVERQFIFTRETWGLRSMTVTGFPAKIKNFRNATPEEISILEAVHNQDCTNGVAVKNEGGTWSIITGFFKNLFGH